jgi:hypothetical protein
MKNILILFSILLASHIGYAQSTHDFLLSGGLDVVKTDNNKLFDKAQIGIEANYFIERRFAVGAGVELWTKQKNSFVMGARWYANENIFLRFRGLIGANDAALGAGWSKALNETLRVEAIGDFYLNSSQFALRAGVGYVIRRK